MRTGQQGEDLAGVTGPKTKIEINGRNRIPDELTETTLREIKNRESESLTQQIRDFIDYSQATGRQFILEVREGANISGPLREAAEKGLVEIRNIGGGKILP